MDSDLPTPAVKNEEPEASTSEPEKEEKRNSIARSQHSLTEEPSILFITPTCNSCQEKIDGEYVFANGATWHLDHFKCQQCETPLTTFAFHEGHYYCKEDYFKLFGAKCKKCGMTITEAYINALDQCWHKDHWTCEGCKKKLEETEFYDVENTPYCRDCYARDFCPTCPNCNMPVVDDRVVALSRRYHVECFKCSGCDKVIGRDQYFIQNRQFYCAACSSQLFDNLD